MPVMPPTNNTNLAGKPSAKDETHPSTATRRTTSSARPQEPAVKCPRCDSPNTKFCYYNNYSLTQPRHFCKTCRRYWTKGGALRNVPIGGGCRKNKKMKSSPRLSGGDSKDSSASSDAGGLKFFQGLSPAMDFQINIPKLHSPNTTNLFNQFPSFDNLSNTSPTITQTPSFNLDPSLMGFNFPLASSNIHSHTNLASSIESLSSINQDLHWKLQQQRLATLFVENSQKEASGSLEKTQAIQFHNLETPKADSCDLIGTSRNKDNNFSTTEWFFSNSYAAVAPINPATSSGCDLNGNSGNNWSNPGTQAWNELTQFTSSLP